GVTLGLLHGTMPEVLVLVHQAGRTAIEEPPFTELPPLREMVETYEQIASVVRPCRVACVAVNCRGLTRAEARAAIDEVAGATGLPAGDVMSGDAPMLWDAVAAALDSQE
ncbi:MAG: NAD-dependent epimerase/dehydratase family protein, partial [Actinomycetota bacterium]|nr:NAD-dependent epimerase/dehydratase family protein [Actinomycetota bacterium]